MKTFLAPLVAAALAAPLSAQTIDVDQPSNTVCMAGFWQADLAQSFIPTASDCSGAGLFMRASTGFAENVTIELWDALPTAGGTQLATGTVFGSPGTWVDVYWPSVSVTAGSTYYLLFSSDTASMCVAGDTGDPYSGGQVYANAGYGSFPSYDYTFRTWTGGGLTLAATGTCPALVFTITGASPFAPVALLSSPTTGSLVIPGGPCPGITLGITSPTLRVINAADAAGSITLTANIPAGACGTQFVQAVDLTACVTSNVEAL